MPPGDATDADAMVMQRSAGRAVWVAPARAGALGLPDDPAAVARWACELIDGLPGDAHQLKADRRSTVWRCAAAGRDWVVKRIVRSRLQTAMYHPARATQAWREVRGARRLARAGVRANPPVALIHAGAGVQWLVLPYVVGPTLDALITDRGPTAESLDAKLALRLKLARAVGRQLGQLTAAGLVNRDAKPSNLIVDEPCLAGDAEPVMIDPVGIGRRRGMAQIEAMLLVTMRAALRVGPVRPREAIAAACAMCEADPSLLAGEPRRARALARLVYFRLNDYYRHHDPHDGHRLPEPVAPGQPLGPQWPPLTEADVRSAP